jgi:outer membrane protein
VKACFGNVMAGQPSVCYGRGMIALRDVFAGLRRFGICAVLAMLMASLLPVPGHAEADNPVVMVIDVELVLRDSAAAKAMRGTIDEKRKEYEALIDEERRKLKDEEDRLGQQKTILSPDVFAQRRRQLEADYSALRRKADQLRDALNGAVNGARIELRQAMASVVAELMKEKGVNMTLERRAVLLFDERLNMSDEVLARLDKQLPTVELKFREPPAN